MGNAEKSRIRIVDLRFRVSREEITSDTWTAIKVADLGNSNLVKSGDVVIMPGNTFGYADGTGYGIISSNSYKEVFFRWRVGYWRQTLHVQRREQRNLI